MISRNILLLLSPVPQSRILGIARYAKEHQWTLSIGERGNPPTDWTGDGILAMLRHEAKDRAFIDRQVKRGIPVVDLTVLCPQIALPRVIGDNLTIGRLAADHFRERHFTHLAFFASHRSHVQKLRYQGFCDCITESCRISSKEVPFLTHEDLSAKLPGLPKPLGLFCYSDYDASLALSHCRSLGLKVPDEVAILGVDNNKILCENQAVPISSVFHDHESVGYRAAELLDRLMRTEPIAENLPILVPPRGIVTRKSTDVTASDDPCIKSVTTYVRANMQRSFGISEIADHLGMPTHRLSRLFKAKTGHTIGHEILRLRMETASQLLRLGQMTISEIADRTGFCNIAYFSNTFRRHFGTSPRQFVISGSQKSE